MSLGDIRNLDYTVLLCSKMKETRQFYLEVMGFPLAHDSERWVSFQVGSALLTLKPRGPGLAWADGPIAPGSAGATRLPGRAASDRFLLCGVAIQRGDDPEPAAGYSGLAAPRTVLPR